jgi:hypothetical protein
MEFLKSRKLDKSDYWKSGMTAGSCPVARRNLVPAIPPK